MLMGEGQYQKSTRQIDYPPGVYTQVAVATRKA